MREIKFRAWDKKHDIIHTGVSVFNFQDFKESILIENSDIELMQFTGLHDKNGKEIYEGDIVSFPKNDGTIPKLSIIYNNRFACFQFKEQNAPIGLSMSYEVIGNIYESPELLDK